MAQTTLLCSKTVPLHILSMYIQSRRRNLNFKINAVAGQLMQLLATASFPGMQLLGIRIRQKNSYFFLISYLPYFFYRRCIKFCRLCGYPIS